MTRGAPPAVWPRLPYGVGGLATFVDEAASGWLVLVDPPWTPGGLFVGGFPTLGHAVDFVYGPLAGQQRLPLAVERSSTGRWRGSSGCRWPSSGFDYA